MEKKKFEDVLTIIKYNKNICNLYDKLIEFELLGKREQYNDIINLLKYETSKSDKILRGLYLDDNEFNELMNIIFDLNEDHNFNEINGTKIVNERIRRFIRHYGYEEYESDKNISKVNNAAEKVIINGKEFDYDVSIELLENNDHGEYASLLRKKKEEDDKLRVDLIKRFNKHYLLLERIESHSFLEALEDVISVANSDIYKKYLTIYKYSLISVNKSLEYNFLYRNNERITDKLIQEFVEDFGPRTKMVYDIELEKNIDENLLVLASGADIEYRDYLDLTNDVILITKIKSLYNILDNKDKAYESIHSTLDLLKENQNNRKRTILSLIK